MSDTDLQLLDTLCQIALNRRGIGTITGKNIRGGGPGEAVMYIPGLRSPK